ncbi:MAG: carbohydrate ABC transporter permease [Chloroflexi bacterium]|nr:carbohydrate ABC transporter permease [Chloroflexota bacterium]
MSTTAISRPRLSRRQRKLLRGIILYFLVLLVVLYTLAPVVWLVISSITPLTDLLTIPLRWIPRHPTFKNYQAIIAATPQTAGVNYQFKVALWNSLVVSLGVTLLCLVTGSMAAYAFARLDMPFKDRLVFILLFTQMLPGIAILIPLFLIGSRLHMLDRRITLIIVYCSFTLPFIVWMMRGYFETIPKDLEDAAMIDGCSQIGTLFRVVIPLSTPGLFATGVFAFLGAWNEFMIALALTNTLASKTMPVALAEFIGRFTVDYGLMSTVGVIASLPPILLALAFQRYLLEGLTSGAVKG